MPQLYSPEWFDAFNEAVADLEVSPEATTDEPTSFRLVQLVRDAPDGELVVVLDVDQGKAVLHRGDPGAADDPSVRPRVAVSLAYEDAVTLSRGELDAAQMIGTGRVKVRGDLSVLVASQAVLAAAASRLSALAAGTTY